MAIALLTESHTELAMFEITPMLVTLPQPIRDGLLWWMVVQGLMRLYPRTPRVGPPRDVTFDVTANPEKIDSIVVRHRCDECQATLDEAKQFLRDHPGTPVAIAQYDLDFLTEIN